MECSAEHVCHLHLLIDSVTKKCDGQTDGRTDAGQKKKESLSAYHATQGDTIKELNKVENMWQKEKWLIMNNYSFCNDNFKSRLLLRWQKASVYWKGLKHYYVDIISQH